MRIFLFIYLFINLHVTGLISIRAFWFLSSDWLENEAFTFVQGLSGAVFLSPTYGLWAERIPLFHLSSLAMGSICC